MAQEPATAPPAGSARKWWICVLLLLATTVNYMDRQTLNQTAVRIARYFGLNNAQYGSLESGFNVAFGIGALVFGWVVDRGNVRWIYPAVVVAWSAVGFATGLVDSFALLLVCRFFLGLFEAGNWPCGILTIKRVLKPAERSLGGGMFQSGTALGAIITPLVVLACFRSADPNEPIRSATAAVVGGAAYAADPPSPLAWRLPFLMVGGIGLAWAALWLLTVRSRHVAAAPGDAEAGGSYWDLWRDRKFRVLIVVVVCVNTTWRSFGFWLPKFLQEGRAYGETDMSLFSSLFYVAADAGSLAVGFGTIFLAGRGWRLHSARMLTFAVCSALTCLSVAAVLLPKGPALLVVLLFLAFGGLGLFPTYFALSQEVSSRHQGKVTGTLGAINAGVLAVVFALQGLVIDATGSYAWALGPAGLAPLVALAVVRKYWPRT